MTSDGGFTLPAGTVSMLVAQPAAPGRGVSQAVAAAARTHPGAGLAHRRRGRRPRRGVRARLGRRRLRPGRPARAGGGSGTGRETDFSEPIKLFRGETPDIAQHPPVERSMLNPRAGKDVEFMHAEELVCVVDKESFIAETSKNPALEVIVKLPFGEERYISVQAGLI